MNTTSRAIPNDRASGGALYQLISARELWVGAYVEVNARCDKNGIVWKITPQENGTYLNLIKGVLPRRDLVPAAIF